MAGGRKSNRLNSRPGPNSYAAFFLMIRRPPRSTLFPYSRSSDLRRLRGAVGGFDRAVDEIEKPPFFMKNGGRSEEQPSELKARAKLVCRFFFNDPATTEIYTLSLQPLFRSSSAARRCRRLRSRGGRNREAAVLHEEWR